MTFPKILNLITLERRVRRFHVKFPVTPSLRQPGMWRNELDKLLTSLKRNFRTGCTQSHLQLETYKQIL